MMNLFGSCPTLRMSYENDLATTVGREIAHNTSESEIDLSQLI